MTQISPIAAFSPDTPAASGERRLRCAVLEAAFLDATKDSGPNGKPNLDQHQAAAWISGCGKDFRMVCEMAGMDPDFLSEALTSGRFSRDLLKSKGDR